MRGLTIPEGCEPIVVLAEHLATRLAGFKRPDGLLAYWHQPTNQKRLQELPTPVRRALVWQVHRRLNQLNQAGPY
ncbi:hypothetical protein UFOVP315_39 [uncultured Caudovirales phage]|uniref:Uncharacterized protein n=1 Tax=uncultured Caudovirales phage TaxID=2100421 RepID=A0A6J5LVN8_9CAUD|nr:hypothetical protein UFOVP315_39 [uncultured Caudovirales phage]